MRHIGQAKKLVVKEWVLKTLIETGKKSYTLVMFVGKVFQM